MDLEKLMTVSFDKNVGTADRVVRAAGALALTGAGWYLGLATWAAVGMSVLGVMTLATAVLSKCSIYSLMGYSTCPTSGAPSPFRKAA